MNTYNSRPTDTRNFFQRNFIKQKKKRDSMGAREREFQLIVIYELTLKNCFLNNLKEGAKKIITDQLDTTACLLEEDQSAAHSLSKDKANSSYSFEITNYCWRTDDFCCLISAVTFHF